jgi:hypothetical protein
MMIITALKYSLLSFAIAIIAIPLGFAAWIGLAIIGF